MVRRTTRRIADVDALLARRTTRRIAEVDGVAKGLLLVYAIFFSILATEVF